MPDRVTWQPHDVGAPISQGDLLVVAWSKTIEPAAARPGSATYPTPGQRDDFDIQFWDDGGAPAVLEMWGRMNYGLAVVIAESCAIDKEYNILFERYREGLGEAEAATRAMAEAEPYVTIAEVWPVSALPEHLRDGATTGALGYVPFTLETIERSDSRVFVVDLNRIATVSWRSIHRRLGIGDAPWSFRLQSALCRFFAARSIRVNEDLETLFSQIVLRVEPLTPPSGRPAKQRARFHFADGRSAVLEAVVEAGPAQPDDNIGRPGLRTRDDTKT